MDKWFETVVPKSKWVYLGKGSGNGEIHTITSVADDVVVTWGDSGHSFLGSLFEFLDNFKQK